MEEAGISPDSEIVIQAIHGSIIISKTTAQVAVNTDLSTWDAQFKRAIKAHGRSTDELWQDIQNKFDEEEWT